MEVLNINFIEYHDNTGVKQKIVALIQSLNQLELVSRCVMLTHLDEQVLFAANLMDQKAYQQRKVKAIT
jgi:hypothetical protein